MSEEKPEQTKTSDGAKKQSVNVGDYPVVVDHHARRAKYRARVTTNLATNPERTTHFQTPDTQSRTGIAIDYTKKPGDAKPETQKPLTAEQPGKTTVAPEKQGVREWLFRKLKRKQS